MPIPPADPFITPPVIIVSPALRAGTTLIQRLLCSAPNTLIYGDLVGQEMEFFARYYAAKAQMFQFQESLLAPLRQAVLAGNTADFISPLAPTTACYLRGLKRAALTWLHGSQEEAIAAHRPIWGWKMAGADSLAITLLAEWFPAARWIYIERDLTDCFRSAKAAGMVQGAAEATRFATTAAAAKQAFQPLASRALMLDYTNILQHQTTTISQLEAHTGAKGISPDVFSLRLNQPGTQAYTPPASLTEEEHSALGHTDRNTATIKTAQD